VEEQAERLLRQMLGPGVRFRLGQWEAIRLVVEDRARVLVVQQTGWGKSLVYFIATRLLRDRGAGPTLLISPLLSLMRNQIEMARRIGIRALSINSANSNAWRAVEEALATDACDVLLVSPERLGNQDFVRTTAPRCPRSNAALASSWWTKRTAYPIGATTSARTIAVSSASSATCHPRCPCSPRPRRLTTEWWRTSQHSLAPA